MDRVAIITAATKGMGRACAEVFARDGYKVVLLARSAEVIALGERLDGIGVQGSVTATDDLKKLVDTAMSTYGRIDVVVNNTGHPPKGDLLDVSDQQWHDGLDITIMNVIRMSRLVAPIMKAQGGGSIINISTFAAFEPSLNFPVSSALRAGLGAFVKLFAERFGADNIRMNNILPGFIESYPAGQEVIDQIPLGRQGKTEEIGKTALFLASEGAKYITGENLKVDGGITKHI